MIAMSKVMTFSFVGTVLLTKPKSKVPLLLLVSDYFVKKHNYNLNQEKQFPTVHSVICSSISEISYNNIMPIVIM